MEVQLQAKFLGVSRRLGKADEQGKQRAYVDVSLATVRRNTTETIGLAATELRADPSIFTQASKLAPLTDVTCYVEQTEYTRKEGAVETVSVIVGLEPKATK